MLHIFWLSCIYCIDKLVTCELTIEMKHLIFLFKNVTTWRQMLSVFCLIFKHFKISSNPFHIANSNQNEKKIGPLCLVCHGLPENAFQVNQLYNLTWSSTEVYLTISRWGAKVSGMIAKVGGCSLNKSISIFIRPQRPRKA